MRAQIICRVSLLASLWFAGACASSTAAGPAVAAPPAPPPSPVVADAPPPAAPVAAARVDGQIITMSELDAHQSRTGLPRPQALEDLIDLSLLRRAASQHGLDLPSGAVAPEARAVAEFELARQLGLAVAPASYVLRVDHVWVKDSKQKKAQAAQRAAIERLRGLVEAGDTIPAGYDKLGVAGTTWHVGDHEEYPYAVIPPAARDLPAGSLSPVVAGDGGLHLFKIIEHRQVRPAAAGVSAVLRPYLRAGKSIEVIER
jgi:hypothetical protein